MYQSTRIGDCEFYLERDALRLYSHGFGQTTGFSTRMSSENVLQLLDWLAQHREEIVVAARAHDKESRKEPEYEW